MISRKIRKLAKLLRADEVLFDGHSHVFKFPNTDAFEYAQRACSHMMKYPKATRPRFWGRGHDVDGKLFVQLALH